MVFGGLKIKAEPKGKPEEEIVHMRSREGGEFPGRILERVVSGWHGLNGGGVVEEAESET